MLTILAYIKDYNPKQLVIIILIILIIISNNVFIVYFQMLAAKQCCTGQRCIMYTGMYTHRTLHLSMILPIRKMITIIYQTIVLVHYQLNTANLLSLFSLPSTPLLFI